MTPFTPRVYDDAARAQYRAEALRLLDTPPAHSSMEQSAVEKRYAETFNVPEQEQKGGGDE